MMRVFWVRYFFVNNHMFTTIVAFLKNHSNLTFTLLGVLIFVVLVSSLIFGINFAVTNIKQAFEVGEGEVAPVPHFNFAGLTQLKLPVR